MSIGQRIKIFMMQEGLTQVELSSKVDIVRQTIGNAINGKNEPSGEVLSKILNAFPNLNARWLLTGQGDMHIQNGTTGSIIKYGNGVGEPEVNYVRLKNLEEENSHLKDELLNCKTKYIALLESKK
jgi:transcriptional regulator with XRE-family HTH domain